LRGTSPDGPRQPYWPCHLHSRESRQTLAREGKSRQGMWEANRVGIGYPLWGVATPRRGLREASCWWARLAQMHLPGPA
jgi:hypothetical protein